MSWMILITELQKLLKCKLISVIILIILYFQDLIVMRDGFNILLPKVSIVLYN